MARYVNYDNAKREVKARYVVGSDNKYHKVKSRWVVTSDKTYKKIFGGNAIATFYTEIHNQSCKYVVTADGNELTYKAKTGNNGIGAGTSRVFFCLNNSSTISNAVVEFDFSFQKGGYSHSVGNAFLQYDGDPNTSSLNYYINIRNAESGGVTNQHITLETNKNFGAHSYIGFEDAMGNENSSFNTMIVKNFTINGKHYDFEANSSN